MASDEKTPYVLRPEARPLRWDLLNASQQSAFRKILNALKDACRDVEQASQQKPEGIAPNLPTDPDRFRSSRLIFISGKRGTGKSTVLVSLFEAFLHSSQFCQPKPADAQGEQDKKFNIKRDLDNLCSRVIWLEPLDMEPLPRPVNLLAAILARVDRAVARFTQKRDDKTYQSGLLSLASGEKALHGLRKLAADVAIAWDGNVDARASALDPDAYAAEVNRVEEARVGINLGLNKALDELAHELGKGSYVKNPFFVLPVDDYDLNPLRSLELLHLIRMVSSPRLFIIILGDIRTAEAMFNIKKSGEFAKVLEAARIPDYLSISTAEIAGIARALSGNALRKLVPPGQRVELDPLKIDEAFIFHPLNLKNDTALSSADALGTLLKGIPVDIETSFWLPIHVTEDDDITGIYTRQSIAGHEISNLKAFLSFDVLHGTEGEGGEQAFPYTGATFLRASPRLNADLWFSLKDIVGEKQNLPMIKREWDERLGKFIDLIGMETHQALEEDEILSMNYRERFLDALGDETGVDWLQAMKFIEARSTSIPGREVSFPDHNCILQANFKQSWSFWDLKDGAQIDIGDRTKALIVLLHDLLALKRGGGIVGSHILSPNSMDLGWAFASWDFGSQEPIIVAWPAPAWTSFWEFDQLSYLWSLALKSTFWHKIDSGLKRRRSPEEETTSLASFSLELLQRAFLLYIWITGVTLIFAADPLDADLTFSTDHLVDVDANSPAWSKLSKPITALLQESRESTIRAERIKSWLIRMLVLLAPESSLIGIQDSDPQVKIVSTLLRKSPWRNFLTKSRVNRIRTLRAARLAPFLKDQDMLKQMILESKNPINEFVVGDSSLKPELSEIEQAADRIYRGKTSSGHQTTGGRT